MSQSRPSPFVVPPRRSRRGRLRDGVRWAAAELANAGALAFGALCAVVLVAALVWGSWLLVDAVGSRTVPAAVRRAPLTDRQAVVQSARVMRELFGRWGPGDPRTCALLTASGRADLFPDGCRAAMRALRREPAGPWRVARVQAAFRPDRLRARIYRDPQGLVVAVRLRVVGDDLRAGLVRRSSGLWRVDLVTGGRR